VAPKILLRQTFDSLADRWIDKVLVPRAPTSLLRLGSRGLADFRAKVAEYVKAVWLLKDKGAVKVKKDRLNRRLERCVWVLVNHAGVFL
jgi:hypothetical protein